MVDVDQRTYWTLIEATAWIACRNLDAVRFCCRPRTASATALIVWMTANDYSNAEDKVPEAVGHLHEALKRGDQQAFGKYDSVQESRHIPVTAWIDIEVSHQLPAISSFESCSEKWSDILVVREAIQSQWPPGKTDAEPSKRNHPIVTKAQMKKVFQERYKKAERDGVRTSRENDEAFFRENWPHMGGVRERVRALRQELLPDERLKGGRPSRQRK